MPVKRNTRFILAASAWTLLIFVLLVVPEGGLSRKGFLGFSTLDKAAHAVMFFLFVVLWFRALAPARAGTEKKALALGLAQASFLYGTNMEFVQALFTTRAFEWWDIVADGLGAYAGYLWAAKK